MLKKILKAKATVYVAGVKCEVCAVLENIRAIYKPQTKADKAAKKKREMLGYSKPGISVFKFHLGVKLTNSPKFIGQEYTENKG
jgi:SRSO17 transposase